MASTFDAAVATGCIKGIRHDRRDGPTRVVTLEYEVRKSFEDKLWLFILNGPTGYESMPFNSIPEALVRQVPWAANFGSDVYDKLDVPYGQLRRVWEAHPELQSRRCYSHQTNSCACRESRCCSTYTHGCGDINHPGFDSDLNGA